MESQRRGDDGRGEREGEEKMKAVLIDPPPPPPPARRCPRCSSEDTKFCYYNNYSQSQPRHFCKTCRRYWTEGGALRNIPVGGTARRYKRPRYEAAPQLPATVPHQLIVPSAALLSRSASAPYLRPAQQINPGCGTGFFSSLVKLQSLNVDPFESVWGTYSGNYLHGVNYGTGFKLPKINLPAGQEDDRWSAFAAAGVRLPEVSAGRDDDESEDVKPDLRRPGDGHGAGASGSHGN